MNKLIIALLAVAMLFSCGQGSSDAADITKIVVASDATWPPMEYMDGDKMIGFDIDLMNAIAKEAGFEVEIKNTAWDGIFAGLANDSYDAVISSVTITEERQKKFDFSTPYVNAGQVIIVRKGMESSISSLTDLEGSSIGAQIGTTGAIEVGKNDKITLKTYDELGFAIADLVNGNIEAVVADKPTAASFVLESTTYDSELTITGDAFTDEYYGIVVAKGNAKVLELINKGLAAVNEKGLNKELENKWLK